MHASAAAITAYHIMVLMYVFATYPDSLRKSWRRSSSARTQEKMLSDGELSENFGLVHPDHTLVDLVPGFYQRKKMIGEL